MLYFPNIKLSFFHFFFKKPKYPPNRFDVSSYFLSFIGFRQSRKIRMEMKDVRVWST